MTKASLHTQVIQLYDPLLGYVKKRVNHLQDAEDLTQEVFLRLSKSYHQDIDNFKSWLYRIANNAIIDYYRKNRQHPQVIEDDIYDNLESSEEAGAELSKCISSFVNQLPEEYRELMILSELEGIPQKEIAQQLGINYVTVRSKIQRGRKKLRSLLEDCCLVLQGGKGSIMSYEKKQNSRTSC